MRTRIVVLSATLMLILGACGGVDPSDPGARAVAEDDRGSAASPDATVSGEARKQEGRNDKKDGQAEGPGNGGDQAAMGSEGAGEGTAEDDGSSRWYPQHGVYVYSQSGFEEFCDASGCQRQDLPATQEVRTTYESVSDSEAVVVTAAQASDNRFVRTTTRHTRSGAFVTHVRLEFDYQGARFNNDYEPDPPVEVARLPLREGQHWEGQWDARTSGRYQVEVGPKVPVTVRDRTVQAFELRVRTTFRGDFEGNSFVRFWVDPATAAIVKTAGQIDVSSFFGDYKTRFQATLRDAPGYQ